MDNRLIKTGRLFYGIMISGIGVQQLFYSEFRPVILPAWPIPGLAIWVWLFSAVLVGAGFAIIFEKKTRKVALLLGGIFFALFCLGHTPYEIFVDPYSQHLGVWTNALKELALSGGAFAIAGSFPQGEPAAQNDSTLIRLLEKVIPLGSIFFSITMICFGIDHFLYPAGVSKLVPAWTPPALFWTYFAAVALIGSGVGIILKIKLKLVSLLLGLMIFLWLMVLHIPRAIADPFGDKGNEVTSVFEALGFSGVAFVIAFGYYTGKRKEVSGITG